MWAIAASRVEQYVKEGIVCQRKEFIGSGLTVATSITPCKTDTDIFSCPEGGL